jgi:hypothetical protein
MDYSKDIYTGLTRRGFAPHHAFGIMGNFAGESDLNPALNERRPLVPGSRGGYGLAQWTGPRRVALENYAASRGVQPSDLNTQLDFLQQELDGSENKAGQALRATTNPEEAARVFESQFLRPGIPTTQRRVAEANRFASLFGGEQSPMTMALQQPEQGYAGLPPEITGGQSAPVMSANSVTGGPGILSSDYDVGQRMVNAGAHLRDDPSALRVVDASGGKNKLQPIQGKDGSWYTFDPRTGAMKPLMAGNPNAEAERAGAIAKAQATAKQEVEQEAAKPKAIAHARMASEQAGDVIREATELADHPQLGNTTGVTGMVLRNIPGTQWHDLGQRIDTLGNKIQTGVLQSIREASANGASGFGTLTEKEGLVLRDLIASLKASQSEGQLRTNLRKIADWGARNRVNINDTLGQTYPELRQQKPALDSFDK